MKALRMLFSNTKKKPAKKMMMILDDEVRQLISLIHSSKTIKQLQQIHAQIILRHHFSNSRIVTQLISSYSFKPHFITHALSIFRHFPNPNLYIFNSLIRALSDHSYFMTSLSYFLLMLTSSNVTPNRLTFPFVLKSAAALQDPCLGMQIHTNILKLGLLSDRLVLLHLLDMYAKVGLLDYAHQLFDQTSQWGDAPLLWNVLINGYCKVGKWGKAMELFQVMPEKYGSTWNTLINGLMKAGEIDRAMDLWHHSVEITRNVVSWTTMINGFSLNGQHQKALSMFDQMLEQGVKPNDQTIVCVLLACAKAGALQTGSRVHDYILSNGFALKKGITAALVDMYAKCGSIERASRVFDMAEEKDLRTWSVMIWGCAINGYLDKALHCFNTMMATGIKPDGVVFLAIITACLHAGNVDQGLRFFDKMKHDYSIEPTMKHYAVIVDLYGRAGRLNQALRFIKSMSIDPDFVIWGALFSACRVHKNIQMAEYASEKLLELEPKHPGGYVFLSNVYAGAGRWQDVEKVRTKMKNKGVAKDPGWSYIEMHGQVTSFVAGDHFHDRSDEIHLKLDEIIKNAREFGYMPETEWVLHNIEEEEKEESLGSHSEKLALAFALISGDDLKVIRIVKNLKICGDCHSLMKHASKMTKKDIVVRDIKRFHHFKNGSCSCQDYW